MKVRRIHHASGSRIEPPLDQSWSDLEKLRWHAAVIEHDTGAPVRIDTARYWIGAVLQRGFYDITLGGTNIGPLSYNAAWDYLNGIAIGARYAVRKETTP